MCRYQIEKHSHQSIDSNTCIGELQPAKHCKREEGRYTETKGVSLGNEGCMLSSLLFEFMIVQSRKNPVSGKFLQIRKVFETSSLLAE